MSILIKSMEMPQNCAECFIGFCMQIGCEHYIEFNDCAITRHPDCPLRELPPHGRLIDADKLMQRMWDETDCMISVPATFVRDAPTVIPASKEG